MRAIVALAGSLICAQACLAQNVPPPPKPDTGPSLEVTMKFIQDKLQDQDPITYIEKTETEGDSDSGNSYQILQAHTDAATCTLTLQTESITEWTGALNQVGGGVTYRKYRMKWQFFYKVPFSKIEKLDVKDANSGDNPLVPKYSILTLYAANHAILMDRTCVEGCDDSIPQHLQANGAALWLISENTANRLAKAMLHAVELCGGGNHDPF